MRARVAGDREGAERGSLVDADVAGQKRSRVCQPRDQHVEQRGADAQVDADGVQTEEDSEPAGEPGDHQDRTGP